MSLGCHRVYHLAPQRNEKKTTLILDIRLYPQRCAVVICLHAKYGRRNTFDGPDLGHMAVNYGINEFK